MPGNMDALLGDPKLPFARRLYVDVGDSGGKVQGTAHADIAHEYMGESATHREGWRGGACIEPAEMTPTPDTSKTPPQQEGKLMT